MLKPENYDLLLNELAALIRTKNESIKYLTYRIEILEEKIREAEKTVEPFPIAKED